MTQDDMSALSDLASFAKLEELLEARSQEGSTQATLTFEAFEVDLGHAIRHVENELKTSIGNIKPLFTRAHPPAPPRAHPAAPALRSQRRPLDGGGWPYGLGLGDGQPARLGLLGLGGWGCRGGLPRGGIKRDERC